MEARGQWWGISKVGHNQSFWATNMTAQAQHSCRILSFAFWKPHPLTQETEACSISRCTKYKEHLLQYALEKAILSHDPKRNKYLKTERSLFDADSNWFDCIAIVNNLNLINSVEIGTVWIIGRLACRWRDGVVRKRLLPPVIGCMCGMAGYINVLSIDTSI